MSNVDEGIDYVGRGLALNVAFSSMKNADRIAWLWLVPANSA